ncbi:FG-GAP-like repeat-containing protein [Microcoleus asticus]|uniref:M23ase beta-sheet core domain-containing protein n=1 Tax=Microcoleus asticus IPMA8 TaxID=2563858 RepID=A0ABX2D3N4_9CYAN|nr:FG-GAP-like repeat-containing protein [Microcoleus asticus]NQE36572.1 hypothetical protein [Microcoleus asticus IPMA8]
MSNEFLTPFDSNGLNLALNRVQSQLQTFFTSPNALQQLGQVFDITNPNAAHSLIQSGAAGNLENIMPHFQILTDTAMKGAQAAFSETQDTIYLAQSLLQGDSLKVQEVLIEELGHKFDTLLNPGGDTSGDEGELFKDVVLGLPLSQPELLRIQTENDFGTVVVDNQVIPVEQAQNSTDVTGDGKADAIVANEDGVYVRRSNGSKFLPNEKWIDIPFWGSIGTGFADVTGDGKADAIASNNDGVYVRRSDGSKFLPNEKWTDIGYWGTKGSWFADVTGDGKADAIVSNDDGVYIRRSDGNKFLPNEKWTDIGYLGSKAAGFGDVTGDGKADAIVSNDDGVYKGVYVRRSDGSKFLPTEKWTDIAYWGTKGTWFGDVALTGTSLTPPPPPGYYREISSLSETQWDQQSGDNNQFEQYPLGGGGDQRGKTDDRIEQIYTDLSNTIFGYRVPMNTGYAYDQSYYSGYGTWHAGLDMGANNGATIKAAIGGRVTWTSGSGDGNIFVGINSDDGRQWVYGHLKSASGLSNGKRINAGETVGIVGAQNHLHLEVENGQAYGGTQGAMTNRGTLLGVTVSPLMAYWQWRNR